uniref:Uncharacterized protein n=1 Tax=Arundo donax TaxID=35708 RepID=A0A0A9G0X3_ARUDO
MEEEIIQIESFRPGWSSLKEGCLDDTKQVMGQSVLLASHSSSRSVEAPPEEASSVEEETSTLLKVEKKNKLKPSSSGDLGKIAQIEDEHSDKKPSSEDLSKTIAQDEDEQHSMLGVHAIEDHKQEQGGRAGECVQSLLDLDDDTIQRRPLITLNS